ncbi:MAG: protein kinase [Microcystaceae cyanobacterium]
MRCLNCHTDNLSAELESCPHCGVHLPSLLKDVLPTGQTLKNNTYQINYPLGRGSFGITYCADHKILKKQVAIKEFYPHGMVFRHNITQGVEILETHQFSYQRALERFLQEGQILAKLHHPHIVKVQDLFTEKDTAYLVMDMIQGKPLSVIQEQYTSRQLPYEKIKQLMTPLVDALHTIHQAKIYHLDIKPENILIDAHDQVILIDFGAARQIIDTDMMGTRSYTESYAAPEIIIGGELGVESDIFELGMMLYEFITGMLPPPALSRLLENAAWQPEPLSEPWNRLIKTALAIKREDRPNDVLEWWQGKGDAPQTRPEKLRPQPHTIFPDLKLQGMQQRWGRGWIKTIIPLDETEAIILTAGGVTLLNLRNGQVSWEIDCPIECGAISVDKRHLAIVWQQQIYLWDLQGRTLLQNFLGHTKRINHVAVSSQGKRVVSGSKDGTLRVWDGISGKEVQKMVETTGWVTRVVMTMDGQKIVSGSQDGRLRVWNQESGEEIWQSWEHQGKITCLALSEDNHWLAAGSSDRLISLWNLETGDLVELLGDHQSWVNEIAFSADNRYLASVSSLEDTTIRVWDLKTGKRKQIFHGHWNSLTSIAFCPDSCCLISGSYDYTLRLWDFVNGQPLRQLKMATNWVYGVAVSPDGEAIATGQNDRKISLWSRHHSEPFKLLMGHQDPVSCVAFSPDGHLVASGSWDHTVRLWEKNTGYLLGVFQGHHNWVTDVVFSPDGKYLASSSWDSRIKLWEITPNPITTIVTKPLRTFKGHTDKVKSLAFSPDGHLLVSGGKDYRLRLWEVSSGQELQCLEGHRSQIESVTFSPDGQFILSGSRDKTLRLWHLLSRKQMHIFRGHTDQVLTVAFHPNGELLASGSKDKTIRLWDIMSGDVVRVIRGHTNQVNQIVFLPNESGLIAADNDGIVRLWEI